MDWTFILDFVRESGIYKFFDGNWKNIIMIAIAVLFVILIYVDKSMGNIISDRILNIQDDGGSGRDQVWRTTWSMISESNLEELLFGHGFNAVLKLSPLALSAHNDFLEMLFNYGIIGFVPYLLLHFQLIKQYHK